MAKKTTTVEKLRQLIVLALSSDQSGERLSAVDAIGRILKAKDIDTYRFADSLQLDTPDPNPDPPKLGWRDKVAACKAQPHCLSDRERAFVLSLSRWRGTPTNKQLAWLDRIYENLP
jgi:hypothetical protein